MIEKMVHRHILGLVNFTLYVRMVGCYVRTYTPTSLIFAPLNFPNSHIHLSFIVDVAKSLVILETHDFFRIKNQDHVLLKENSATTTRLRADIQRNNRPRKNFEIVFPIKFENHIDASDTK